MRAENLKFTIQLKQRCDKFDFGYHSLVYGLVKTGFSKMQAEAEELNQSQRVGMSIVIGLFLRFCFRLPQSGFHQIVNNGVLSGVGRKWKRANSSDSDSVGLMTLLTTLIYDFHPVISALTTQLTIVTPTPSLVKTRL